MTRHHVFPALVAAAMVLAAPSAMAQGAVEKFYTGKQLQLQIGAGAGSATDRYARLVGRHLSRFIPGGPRVVFKNMPGAGGRKLAAWIYNAAPRNGLILGAVSPGAIVEPVLGDAGRAAYDSLKFNYVGSANSEVYLCIGWKDAPVASFEDVFTKRRILGASRHGGATRDMAAVLANLLGARFRVVKGFAGTRGITFAMEQGEVHGLCGFGWSALKAAKPGWVDSWNINILVQLALTGDAALIRRGVPMIWDYVKKPEDRKVLELILSQVVFAQPYVMPPETPREWVRSMRQAFGRALQDPEFLGNARKSKLAIARVSGSEVEALIDRIYSAPPEVIARAKAALASK